MSDDARKVIAEVLAAHAFIDGFMSHDGYHPARCLCNKWRDSGPGPNRIRANYRDHAADEIDEALGGLEREWGSVVAWQEPCTHPTEADARANVEAFRELATTVYTPGFAVLQSRWVTGWTEDAT